MLHPEHLPHPPTDAQPQSLLLAPFQAIRQDTSESMWLVSSDKDTYHYSLLVVKGELVEYHCPQAQHDGRCPHVTLVQLVLQIKRPEMFATSAHSIHGSTLYPHPEPRNEQERRLVEAADKRDRALLRTDDHPFSIYKS